MEAAGEGYVEAGKEIEAGEVLTGVKVFLGLLAVVEDASVTRISVDEDLDLAFGVLLGDLSCFLTGIGSAPI